MSLELPHLEVTLLLDKVLHSVQMVMRLLLVLQQLEDKSLVSQLTTLSHSYSIITQTYQVQVIIMDSLLTFMSLERHSTHTLVHGMS